jgi:hypothetical protein
MLIECLKEAAYVLDANITTQLEQKGKHFSGESAMM